MQFCDWTSLGDHKPYTNTKKEKQSDDNIVNGMKSKKKRKKETK